MLAEYYLHHRLSDDLDFFSLEEVDPQIIQIIFKTIKPKIQFEKVTYENSFNRNLFFLHFFNEVIKTEFTYFPFEQIERTRKINMLKIDSILDIAVNKTNAIFTNPRTRDFIDLQLILQKEKWVFHDLIKKARIKFDTYIDPLLIAQKILTIIEVKDYPQMIIPFNFDECKNFWLLEASVLSCR